MVNNFMWLVHKPTSVSIKLAKYYAETGWHVIPRSSEICDKFNAAAYPHLSIAERSKIDRLAIVGPPFAQGSLLGDDWVLQYDHVTPKNQL